MEITSPAEFERQTYSKVTRRLMPYLFLCYVLAYVDRVNVGFAKLQMQQDLAMSDAVYGLGAGIFFLGYFFFEVPANMMLQKLGARLWLGPIMVAWGFMSTATMFVQGARSFYLVRFLLGAVESGFFPGVILYLTFWYTRKQRAKMIAAFMSANPISGVLAGPISGWIIASTTGMGNLRAWQWLFIMEGIPSIVAGLVTTFFLVDYPGKAKWLSQDEKTLLLTRLEEEEESKRLEGESRHRLVDAFKSGKVWLLSLVYFGMVMGNYGLWFWLPQTIKDTLTTDPWRIGLISMIPWGTAAVVMILYGHHSERHGRAPLAHRAGYSVRRGGLRPERPAGHFRRGRLCRSDVRRGRVHVRAIAVLGLAHRDAVGIGRGGRDRLDQLGGQPGGLCESFRNRRNPRQDRQHDARAAAPGGVDANVGAPGNRRRQAAQELGYRSNIKIFAEARYHRMFTRGPGASLIPVTVGIRF